MKQQKTLTELVTWVASTPFQKDLPREGVITQLDFLMDPLQYDVATAAINIYEDGGLKQMLSSLRIEGAGGRGYFDCNDMRLQHFMNAYEYEAPLRHDILPAAVAVDNTARILLRIHPGSYYKDPYDLSAGIPAKDLSSLVWKGVWAADDLLADVAANVAMDAATTLRCIVYQVLGAASPAYKPKSEIYAWTIDSIQTDLGKKVDLPTGCFIRKALILVDDNTAFPGNLRDNTRVTQVALLLPKEQDKRALDESWQALISNTQEHFGPVYPGTAATTGTTATLAIANPKGVAVVDFRKLVDPSINPLGPLFGLDMRAAQPGDIKWGFTTAVANGTLKIFYDLIEV